MTCQCHTCPRVKTSQPATGDLNMKEIKTGRNVIVPLLSKGKCSSHSLEALETCSQPFSLPPGLPWESWLHDLTEVIGNLPPIVPDVSLPSPHSLSHLKSKHFDVFSWNCLLCGEMMVSLSCSINVGLQPSAKSSRGRGSRQRPSTLLLFSHFIQAEQRLSSPMLMALTSGGPSAYIC